MRGDVDTIKERLDITELISGYIKLEKAGQSFKARCPFHNEKTPSFFVSPTRQSFYCFGCGAKGDIFTFVQEVEGLDFREALFLLAEKAGVEVEYKRGESKTEKDKILGILEEAAMFFEKKLDGHEPARRYLNSRGINAETTKNWRIGYAPDEWRSLCNHLAGLGYDRKLIVKAGLSKTSDAAAGKEPYDVFRDRIIFPFSDSSGRIIAFSGRALSQDTEPKYLNSPDTILFTKGEVLYGLDKAKDQIRKRNYAVLVEGQMDLILSHQAGVSNTVASSGTAFTSAHLERLKKLSSRIILAFDGDKAGEIAAEKSAVLGLALGMEVKVADLPLGQDPAGLASKDTTAWKNTLREALPAVEFFFNKAKEKERDPRKFGKQIEKKILPMIKLIRSTIEQSYFVSMLSKRTGIKEEVLWEDLRKVSPVDGARFTPASDLHSVVSLQETASEEKRPYREKIEERLAEIKLWQKELPKSAPEIALLKKEEAELKANLSSAVARDDLGRLLSELSQAEASGNDKAVVSLSARIKEIHNQIRVLEENKEML